MADYPKLAEKLRGVALTYPETYEESPWGDRVVKVRGKIFLMCGVHEGKLHVTAKLPSSRRAALEQPFAKPTGYGLGKAGWVTSTFAGRAAPPVELLQRWIDESYRAVAPKRIVAALDQAEKPAAPKAAPKATPIGRIKKIAKKLLVLAYDPLRTGRAASGFAALGLTIETTDDPARARARLKRPLDGILIDLGKRAAEGLALAAEIDASDAPILIFLAGIPEGSLRKRAQSAATSADLFRGPPGDPEVVGAVLQTLARY